MQDKKDAFFSSKREIFLKLTDNLCASEAGNILKNIKALLKFSEDDSVTFLLRQRDIWMELIPQHSELLTDMGLALGKQTYSSKWDPWTQLLGVYYLALALNEMQNNIQTLGQSYSEQVISYLNGAALYGSSQALFLLRDYYLEDIENRLKIDLNDFKTMLHNFCLKHQAPGYIFYGESLIYLANFLLHQHHNNLNFPYEETCNLFKEGILYCYVGDYLQPISALEINNAYGVNDGFLPYAQGCIFYENSERFEDMDSFCRYVRTQTNFPVNIGEVKREACEKAQELINNYHNSSSLGTQPVINM